MSDDDALTEAARRLFAGRVEFLLSAPALKFLPEPELPEIAFAGRSNVGKSSLLNALTGRKSIARASVTPGRTQELNFFEVGEPTQLRLVDMPGYGYAKAPKKEIKAWQRLLRDYLRGRTGLTRAFVLVDSRHGVMEADVEMFDLLDEAAVTYQIVLTKTDKWSATELADVVARTMEAAKKRAAAFPEIHVTSSETGAGIAELRAEIAGLTA